MNYKDVESNLERRINTLKRVKPNIDRGNAVLLLEQTLSDLKKAMYGPENPESTANSLGLCPRCGQHLPRVATE